MSEMPRDQWWRECARWNLGERGQPCARCGNDVDRPKPALYCTACISLGEWDMAVLADAVDDEMRKRGMHGAGPSVADPVADEGSKQ